MAAAALIGPAGSAPAAGAELLGDLLGDVVEVALEVVLLLPHLRQRGVLLAPGRGELARSAAAASPGRLELLLAGRDLVAGRADGVDGHLHLVAELAHPGDDVVVLVLQRPQVLGAGQQVVEAVRLKQDGDQVRLVRLVDRDQPLLEDLDRPRRRCFRCIEPGLRLIQLGLLLRELGGDRGLLVPEVGDLAGQRWSWADSWLILVVRTPACACACESLFWVALSFCWRLWPEALPTANAQAQASSGAGERQHQQLGSRHLRVTG